MSWYPPATTVAAVSEPLAVADATEQVKADAGDAADQAYILALTKAARSHVEAYCGTPLASRTITVKCDAFTDFSAFPIAPLTSVSSIAYLDGAGANQTLSTDVYEVRTDGLTASIVLKSGQSWPTIQSGSRITVTAVVGYSTIPESIVHALKLLVADWYDRRSGTSDKPITETPHAVAALLSNHRSFAF